MTPTTSLVGATQRDWQCATCRLAARAREGLLATPNNPLIVAAVQAIFAGGAAAELNESGWRRDRSGRPVFEFWSGSGGRIKVSLAGSEQAAWADVAAFSTLTLDCAIGVLTCLGSDAFRAATAAPRREPVRLGAPALLAAKGYKRFGAEREAFADAVDEEIRRLMRLRFEIVAYPGYDPTARKWNSSGISRAGIALFELAPQAPQHDRYDCHRSLPLRFGEWADHWLHAGGALWVSPLPQPILQLDHRNNRGADALAKRVAVLLSLNWGAARKSSEIRIDVRTLLRRVGELRRPGAAAAAHAGRIADRLEEALLRLSETGILPNTLHSEEALVLRSENKRWFEAWCEAVVVFERPDFIGAKTAAAKGPSGAKPDGGRTRR
ncbi:MAG: hypothetical protein AB7T59_07025 [Hyphomonadaceae bacterium]